MIWGISINDKETLIKKLSPSELSGRSPASAACFGTYFKRPLHGTEHWQYFNPKKRKWDFVRKSYDEGSNYMVFRDGWIVRRLGKREDRHDHYLCVSQTLLPLSREKAIKEAISRSFEAATIPCTLKDDLIYVRVGTVFLSDSTYSCLRRMAKHAEERNGIIEVMVFRLEQRADIDRVLRAERIRLVDSEDLRLPKKVLDKNEMEAYKALLKQISETFSLAYSSYLKREDLVERFILLIAHRDWESIDPVELRDKLITLANLVDAGNQVARKLNEFILDKLPILFDWADLGTDNMIQGIIIDTAPLEFQGRWNTNYFKLIVPRLESSLYWQTSLAPTKRGNGEVHHLASRLHGIEMERWRVYPYLGKLRLTGSRENTSFSDRTPSDIHHAFNAIAGVPSFETILRDFAYIDGYNLDLKTWRGGYSFSRYFLAMVRIEDALDSEFPLPTTTVVDVFGNHFGVQWDIDNYLHEESVIASFQYGGWISVLLENELNSLDQDYAIPVFRSAQAIGSRFVTKSEAFKHNVLGVIRYCGFASRSGLAYLSTRSLDESEFDRALKALVEEKRVASSGGFCFYVHNSISSEQAQLLADITTDASKNLPAKTLREEWYVTWSMLRILFPYVHPLVRAQGLFDAPVRSPYAPDAEKYEALQAFVRGESSIHHDLRVRVQKERAKILINAQRSDIDYFEILVGEKNPDRYVSPACSMLQNFGCAVIKARGRWIHKAHGIAQKVAQIYAYADPSVTREDHLERRPDGRIIPSVEFDIRTYCLKEVKEHVAA